MNIARLFTLLTLMLSLLLINCGNSVSAYEGAGKVPPEFRAAIDRAVEYLVMMANHEESKSDGRITIAAYALLHAGEELSHPLVTTALNETVAKCGSSYTPFEGRESIYEAGVDMMILKIADQGTGEYMPQMETITKYLLERQEAHGGWDYTSGSERTAGDTSMTQYALLGLLTAKKAGIEVPQEAWDKAAGWLINWQCNDGGFAYHPAKLRSSTHSMTVAALCALFITRDQLYPSAQKKSSKKDLEESDSEDEKASKLFGVLQAAPSEGLETEQLIEPEKEEEPEVKEEQKPVDPNAEKPKNSLGAISTSIKRALQWMNQRFSIQRATPGQFRLYYLYTMERAAALGDMRKIAGKDWYQLGGEYLLTIERTDEGNPGWGGGHSGKLAGTAFAVLFLAKATARSYGKGGFFRLGKGQMIGGRELKDPNEPDEEDEEEKAKKEKMKEPIDKLLADLMNPSDTNIKAVQQALVENVNFKDREALIAQKPILLKMAADPRFDVRRTAYWALGRTEDYRVIPTLINGLEEPDLDLNIEALLSLCFLTRKPNGLTDQDKSPYNIPGMIEPTASTEEKQAMVVKWRKDLVSRWKKWYFSIRAYDERDDLDELIFKNQQTD